MNNSRFRRGSAAVETAFLLLALTALCVAVHNLGSAWRVKQVLRSAAREGARIAATRPDLALNDPAVIAVVDDIVQKAGLEADSYTCSIQYAGSLQTGIPVTVTLSHDYPFLAGNAIGLGTTLTMTSSSSMRYEQVVSNS